MSPEALMLWELLINKEQEEAWEEGADSVEVWLTEQQIVATVLVVEDIKMTRMILRQMLESDGYAVVEAGDASQAFEALESQPIKLVITDISMPGMDGLQMVQRIRSNPKTADLPVIMCTVSRRKSDISQAVKLGVRGFLAKPVAKEALLAKVAEILERKQGRPFQTGG